MRESLESDQVGALVSVRGQVGNRAQTGHDLDGWRGAQHVGCVSAAVAELPRQNNLREKSSVSAHGFRVSQSITEAEDALGSGSICNSGRGADCSHGCGPESR